MKKTSIIRKTPGKDEWCVKSHDGKKNLGCYDSESKAKERLQQVEYFKHQGRKAALDPGYITLRGPAVVTSSFVEEIPLEFLAINKSGFIGDLYIQIDPDISRVLYRNGKSVPDDARFVGSIMGLLRELGYKGQEFGRAELGMQDPEAGLFVFEPKDDFESWLKDNYGFIEIEADYDPNETFDHDEVSHTVVDILDELGLPYDLDEVLDMVYEAQKEYKVGDEVLIYQNEDAVGSMDAYRLWGKIVNSGDGLYDVEIGFPNGYKVIKGVDPMYMELTSGSTAIARKMAQIEYLSTFSSEDLAEAKLALEELGEEGSKEYEDIVHELDSRVG